jgi:hypothetical protein
VKNAAMEKRFKSNSVDGFVNEPAAGNGMEDVKMAHQQTVKRAVSPDDGQGRSAKHHKKDGSKEQFGLRTMMENCYLQVRVYIPNLIRQESSDPTNH